VAQLLDERWERSFDAPVRKARQGGIFHPYLPDTLTDRALLIDSALAEHAHQVETNVRRLASAPHARSLEGLARFLLRSEAIASSKIEGLQVSPQQLAMAELAQTDESISRGFTRNAALVANNITALRQATTTLSGGSTITVKGIEHLHTALLPDEKLQGIRSVQNWIGGSDWHPFDAAFVPPPAAHARGLIEDLCAYMAGGIHAPLIQAALVHAQFETVHPFVDGNGRVGRALIHTVLVRRGLTPAAILPISLVLLTQSDAYIRGLTAYRYIGSATSAEGREGVSAWLSTFLDAALVAARQAEKFTVAISALTGDWERRLAEHRTARGARSQPRADSAQAKLLGLLPEIPLLTTGTAQGSLGVSFPAARAALEELAEARILSRKQVDRGTTGYLANDVFELLTFAERELASTRWDTRESKPVRATPAVPQIGGGLTTIPEANPL
jgi:Fic family protein